MPSTINGIGTHYYGKKNPSTRTAACKSCGKVSVLESYDTRLWFVIVFIPVIPLGRKRITDKCPRCTRHFVADLQQYEQARQLQISSSLERFRRELSPEAALEAHGQLLAFHETEQAAEFRKSALEKFPVHPMLRANLAAQLEYAAAYAESAQLYEAALKQDPEMPAARVGVARRRMVQGELDEARRLLSFLETAGAGQHHDLGPVDVLSGYFQKAGRHDVALALAAHLLREFPAIGQQHKYRAFVLRSEKALGRFESILPPREHSLRGLFRSEGSPYPSWMRTLIIVGGAGVLLAGGLFVNNEYIRRHRTINVVNACGSPVRVQVDRERPVEFSGNGVLTVGEGRHHLLITGAVEQAVDVELAAGFFDRWFKKPLWVLNPGGEAVLRESTVCYAQNPTPGSQRLLAGQPFVAVPHVDHVFEQPPSQITLSNKNDSVTRVALEWVQGADDTAFLEMYGSDSARALAFAESRLRRFPDQTELFDLYLSRTIPQQARHVEEFLKSGLDRRPIVVAWHRTYQAVTEINGTNQGLIPFYDGLLRAEPASGAVLYLRGRIDPDWSKRRQFFQNACTADPKLSWPWMALGAQSAGEARWSDCLVDLYKARELKAEPKFIRDHLHIATLATGGADKLVADYGGRLAANPMDFALVPLLTDALIVSGHGERVHSELAGWEMHLDQSMRPVFSAMMRAVALYQEGKLEECIRLCEANVPMRGNAYRLQSLLALGRAAQAAQDPEFEKLRTDHWTALAVGLGFLLDGKKNEAAEWHERGCARLDSLTTDFRHAARLLRSAEPPPVDAFAHLSIEADDRALIFALLATRFPARKAEYGAAASRFNISRKIPYQLVHRALGKLKPAPP